MMRIVIVLVVSIWMAGCGLITGTALSHDEYIVLCLTGYKQGTVSAFIVPHDYALPPNMLPKCETGPATNP